MGRVVPPQERNLAGCSVLIKWLSRIQPARPVRPPGWSDRSTRIELDLHEVRPDARTTRYDKAKSPIPPVLPISGSDAGTESGRKPPALDTGSSRLSTRCRSRLRGQASTARPTVYSRDALTPHSYRPA